MDNEDVNIGGSGDTDNFNAREAVQKLAEPYLPDGLPTFTIKNQPIGMLGLMYKRGRLSEITEDMKRQLLLTLYMLVSKKMTPKVQTDFNAKILLERIVLPENKYPEEYRRIADALLKEFTASNWGEEAPPPQASSSLKRSYSGSHKSGYSIISKVPNGDSDPNDPIWGLNGIMRGITKTKSDNGNGSTRISYKATVPDSQKNANLFGHNGAEVGDCWPFLIAAKRDGVHGHHIQGITGTAAEGCFSIVISGGSSGYDADKDEGDVIAYSDSTANDAADNDPNRQGGADVLIQSMQTRKPVRVIRSSKGEWGGRPKAGFRYDGLYTVVDYKARLRRQGKGNFKVFRLERNGGFAGTDATNQGPILTDKPTRKQQSLFQHASDSNF
ncbi:putative E3 ubiquitin-protein ligase UHRF1 [Amylocarpus encephaloides]|uniref:E3 ubiquitin-protein ligase UHRF1 n=1 Tax=Amylocarpus encephaloides TaxID=45428 RepID=A0A9P8C1Z2_9HELO|nr:putative E3 ubiquitin-protein ligase UHRF1 [Amylocarpus encephaloides]